MEIHEPMTLVTDYVLGALCAFLALRLRRGGPRASRSHWSLAFLGSAAAAFLGGTYHGFLPWLHGSVAAPLWKATLLSIGLAAYCAAIATAQSRLSARWVRPVRVVAGVKLCVYAGVVLTTDAFLTAILDYSVAFVFVVTVYLTAWIRYGDMAARWVVSGVLTSFVAAGIQAAGIAPHPQFNHNDLYHVVQMVGMWLLYKGAWRSAPLAR